MSLAGMVESARRGTAPIVGIPLEGEPAFAVRRDLLVNSLKGLKVIDAGIQLHLETGKPDSLVVYAAGDGVKAVRKFSAIPFQWLCAGGYHLGSVKFYQQAWAEKEREKRKAPPKVRTSARQKQIAKLQKQLAKHGIPKPPLHPFRPSEYGDTAQRIRERDARELTGYGSLVADGCQCDCPLTAGQSWRQWKQQARVRRWVQLQARLCISGKMTTTQLYRVLAERGIKARKWSDLNTREKERCCNDLLDSGVFGYLNILWEFCGLATKPSYLFKPAPEPEVGSKHYRHWLAALHEYKELQAAIGGLTVLETELSSQQAPERQETAF